MVQQLASLLSSHSGECDLYLHLATPRHGEVTVKAGAQHKVEPSDTLLQATKELLGHDTIWFAASNAPRKGQ
jgi:hypothetical protein